MAAVAVAFAAADTYVVVLALPDMMTGVGVPIDQLQRAAPIVSGFLLGYVAMLPLIGRIADLRGDRKSTRLNSSHANISYAVFCLKKKKPSPTKTLPTAATP